MRHAAFTKPYLLLVLLTSTVTLAACNLPAPLGAPTQGENLTQVYQTVAAHFTQDVASTQTLASPIAETPSPLPQPTAALTGLPSQETLSAFTLEPTLALASPQVPCDLAAPGNPIDITIPDATQMQPGEAFTKIWRLRNVGTCTWTTQYSLVWFSGNPMGATSVNYLSSEVQPGQSVELALDFTAPQGPGTYQSNWKLSNASGNLFGIGPNGDAPFWVSIVIPEDSTATPATSPPTSTATPAVIVSGPINLFPDQSLDLDTNQVITNENGDVLYSLTADKNHQLTPQNGAGFSQYGTLQPVYQDCYSARPGTAPVNLDGLAVGTYFCYHTNLGLPGWARLVGISTQDDMLTLEILTWEAP